MESEEMEMERATYITPEVGRVYKNKHGGEFECLFRAAPHVAIMQNVKSGWTFTAHGVQKYRDGAIEWDYSTGGRFEEIEAEHAVKNNG